MDGLITCVTVDRFSPVRATTTAPTGQARIQDFLQGGGGQRRPCTAGADGGLGLINIRLRYIASIEYS